MKNDMKHKLQDTPAYGVTARTANATAGAGTSTIADGTTGWVLVTSAGANNIIVLPTPVPGTKLKLVADSTNGFEIRAAASTQYINGVTGAVELAVAANTVVEIECIDNLNWTAISVLYTGILPVPTFGTPDAV